jgi:hypothetical protein
MTEYILTKDQIKKLRSISKSFKHIKNFTIVSKCENGIGPTEICQFNDNGLDISIDITDVSNW